MFLVLCGTAEERTFGTVSDEQQMLATSLSMATFGEIGVALGDLTPEGRILVRGEYWNAVATTPLKTGDRVRVTAIDHLNLTVEPVQNQSRG